MYNKNKDFMQYILFPPKDINCRIDLPASKSISNRALVINALAHDDAEIIHPENLSCCDDTDVMVAALQKMPYVINIKAAGTAMRFMTALLSSREGEHILTGTERMMQRPIHVLVDALRTLGAEIDYVNHEGFPPLRIRGKKMEGGRIEIAGDVSSQYISALLMIGPTMRNGLTLHLTGNIISRPYIDLTVCTMKEFGATVEWENGNTIMVSPQPYRNRAFTIENDWSASSYWYEMVALASHLSTSADGEFQVVLPGLLDGSRQGDSAVRYIFSMLGVKTEFLDDGIRLTHHHRGLPRFDFDFINQPDLAQTVVVTTALLGVPFRFTGLQTLRIKETDRIAALKAEMAKLGYILDDSEEGTLQWDGKRVSPRGDLEGAEIDTYEDHRMAMAFAPACIMYPGLKINNPEVVTKSYPHYWDDLEKAGFEIVKNDD